MSAIQSSATRPKRRSAGALLPWRSKGADALRTALAVLVPVLLVGAVLLYAVDKSLEHYRGNATGFVQFGSLFAGFTHPPASALVGTGTSRAGYDGQFYYVMARDPLLLRDSTVASLRNAPQNVHSTLLGSSNQTYRFQRVGYPALVYLLSRTLHITTAWSMLVLNVVVVLVLTGGFALYLRRRGWSTLWAVALGLMSGLLLSTLRDVPGPMARACALGGLLAWTSRRRTLAVSLIVIAVLTWEATLLAALAIAGDAAVRAWRSRRIPGAVRRATLEAWPVVVLPSLAFAGWHLYVYLRSGGSVGGAGLSLPVANFVHNFDLASGAPPGMAVWEVAYLLLMVAAVAAALLSLRRGVTVLSLGAALFALLFLVAPFNDAWGSTKDSLLMLALLLVLGLERRERALLGICALAAAMTAFVPLAIPGSF